MSGGLRVWRCSKKCFQQFSQILQEYNQPSDLQWRTSCLLQPVFMFHFIPASAALSCKSKNFGWKDFCSCLLAEEKLHVPYPLKHTNTHTQQCTLPGQLNPTPSSWFCAALLLMINQRVTGLLPVAWIWATQQICVCQLCQCPPAPPTHTDCGPPPSSWQEQELLSWLMGSQAKRLLLDYFV